MKQMRIRTVLIFLLALLCSICLMASCGGDKPAETTAAPTVTTPGVTDAPTQPAPEKLTTPVVVLDGDLAVWDADPNADKFEISLDGSLSYLENSVTSKRLEDGQSFKIRAVGDGVNYKTGDWSNVVTYTKTSDAEYTVTFYSEDGTAVLDTVTVEQGGDAVYSKATPLKEATVACTYIFDKWVTAPGGDTAADLTGITGDLSVYASFKSIVKTVSVHIISNNSAYGNVSVSVLNGIPYGTAIAVDGNTVTVGEHTVTATASANTAQYTYAFLNWTADESVKDNTVLVANFSCEINKYTVVWKNGDTVLETDENVEYGAVPVYNGEEPQKPSVGEVEYHFMGWSPEVSAVTGDAVYTANFRAFGPSSTVTFVDHDGTVLNTQTVEYGEDAVAPEDPYREGYRFDGWDKAFTCITEELVVKATYVRQFTVVFLDFDNSIIKIETLDIGEDATAPADPARDKYKFIGWDTDFTDLSEDIEVKAQYVRLYTVRFIDHDGTVLSSAALEGGQNATPPADPTREGYTFAGWSGSYTDIDADTDIEAQYTINRYTVTFLNADGSVLSEIKNVAYGKTVTAPKPAEFYFDWSKTKGYEFTGWKDWEETDPITDNTTIIAEYAKAVTEPIIAVETSAISKGTSQVTVSVYLCGSFEDLYGLSLDLGFADQLAFNAEKTVVSSKLLGFESNFNADENRYDLSWADGQGLDVTGRLEIVTITFQLDKYTEAGSYAVELLGETYIINNKLVRVTPIFVDGQVTVTE